MTLPVPYCGRALPKLNVGLMMVVPDAEVVGAGLVVAAHGGAGVVLVVAHPHLVEQRDFEVAASVGVRRQLAILEQEIGGGRRGARLVGGLLGLRLEGLLAGGGSEGQAGQREGGANQGRS
jgi:hypothetical protein